MGRTGRPVEKTMVLAAGLLEELQGVFGTAATAYRGLRLTQVMRYEQFRQGWRGKAMRPAEAEAVESGWEAFVARMCQIGGAEPVATVERG